MKIGIIKETKIPKDKRTAVIPEHCNILQNPPFNFDIKVAPCSFRSYADFEYLNEQIQLTDQLEDCDILLGIKEVNIDTLIPGKTYFFFSHTIKKQPQNRKLLQAVLNKKIKLIDYETLKDEKGARLIAFGQFAGMVGAHNALWTYGNRHDLFDLPRMKDLADYDQAKKIYKAIKFPNLKIVVTGTGRVAKGAFNVLLDMGIREIPPEIYLTTDHFNYPVFTHLSSLDYVKKKDGSKFSKDEFYKNPELFESNFEPYTRCTDVFINCIYWDDRSPVFFNLEDISDPEFKISVIADVTCDIVPISSVPTTIRASTIKDPVYGIDRSTHQETRPFLDNSIDIMAIDNLPNELPRDASKFFSNQFIHVIVPELIRKESSEILDRATITENGELTKHYQYLQDYVHGN